MIRELGRSLGNTVLEGIGRAASSVQERRPLPVDLLESEDAYLAVFDAPGAHSSDVQVRFDDDTVRVRVDRFREAHENFELRVPGRGLSLSGAIALPADAEVDADAASATLRTNGTLEVRVPKREPDAGVDVVGEDEATAPDGG
ncbi:MAG: Hsp20/alpha crystallin family protein [Halorientalis sp.]